MNVDYKMNKHITGSENSILSSILETLKIL